MARLLARARVGQNAPLRKKIDSRERVFFILRQALEASSKNALNYDECVSGAIIYSYVGGNPLSYTDPLGLATYQCTRKLNNVPFRAGPLYHQYVCTGNAKDGYSCQGLGPTGSMFDSPGKLEPDAYKPEACEKVDDDNQCIEQCIAKRFSSSIPNYSVDLSHGENCQTYARSAVGECEAICRARRK